MAVLTRRPHVEAWKDICRKDSDNWGVQSQVLIATEMNEAGARLALSLVLPRDSALHHRTREIDSHLIMIFRRRGRVGAYI